MSGKYARPTHSGCAEFPRQAGTAADNTAVAPKVMRFGADSLTHGAREILTEGILVKGIRPKSGARHECKIAYSWPDGRHRNRPEGPRAGRMAKGKARRTPGTPDGCGARCTAADSVPTGCHPKLTRLGAHSLTHARRAILTEGIVVNGIRRKMGRRHECKTSDSWPGLGATTASFAVVAGLHGCGQRSRGTKGDAIWRAFSYSWRAGDFDGRHCGELGYAKNRPAP